MKNLKQNIFFSAVIVIVGLLTGTDGIAEEKNSSLIPDPHMAHIGIVVKDIDQSLNHWATLLGLDQKPAVSLATGHHENPTYYRGKRSDAQAKLSFIKLENIQIELIQPVGKKASHWLEFLTENGEGVHHVAFWVKGLGEIHIDRFKKNGITVAQKGGWNGGEYAYMDTLDSLGVMVELLEDYKANAEKKEVP